MIVNNLGMDPRRLALLLALAQQGSMRAVADSHNLTTSSVSQQLSALAKEVGTELTEPDGRRVRLTPAGRRLAEHAVTILAAVESARLDLDPDAEPAGTVRVGGFATGIRVSLMPVLSALSATHPDVEVVINEYEPLEAFRLLMDDELDLAVTYDYNLAPATPNAILESMPLWSAPWGLALPAGEPNPSADLNAYADRPWIVNSRNTADEIAVRTLAALAGFTPRIAHQIDTLDLVEDLIAAGYGIALLPVDRPARHGIQVLPLPEPALIMTAYAVTRRGRAVWPPLKLILNRLEPSSTTPALARWPRSTSLP